MIFLSQFHKHNGVAKTNFRKVIGLVNKQVACKVHITHVTRGAEQTVQDKRNFIALHFAATFIGVLILLV